MMCNMYHGKIGEPSPLKFESLLFKKTNFLVLLSKVKIILTFESSRPEWFLVINPLKLRAIFPLSCFRVGFHGAADFFQSPRGRSFRRRGYLKFIVLESCAAFPVSTAVVEQEAASVVVLTHDFKARCSTSQFRLLPPHARNPSDRQGSSP